MDKKKGIAILIVSVIMILILLGIIGLLAFNFAPTPPPSENNLEVAIYDTQTLYALPETIVQVYNEEQELLEETTTNEKGVAYFTLPDGTYTIIIQKQGYEEKLQQHVNKQDKTQLIDIALTRLNLCVEKWNCTSWSECEDGTKTRDCTDFNKCTTEYEKPEETATCELQDCETNADCDDSNPCTEDECSEDGGTCLHIRVTECMHDDGCCPSNCSHVTDHDCDGTVTPGSCQTNADCDDKFPCTEDYCTGNPLACVYDPITACIDNDDCCPDECDHDSDNDCEEEEGSEDECDSNSDCDDSNPCTEDECSGGDCEHETIIDGTSCGELKMCCSGNCENFCNETRGCSSGDACITYTCEDPGTCSSYCSNITITICDPSTSDGCCPSTCDETNDYDCANAYPDGEPCTNNTECYSNKCDVGDNGACFSCDSCSGTEYNRCSNQETDECEAQCSASSQCDDLLVGSFWNESGTCNTCTNCSHETCSIEDVCGTSTQVTGKICTENGCSEGVTSVCDGTMNCVENICNGTRYNCTSEGTTWAWRTSNPTETGGTRCDDGIDNDCDGYCDYYGCGSLPADPDCTIPCANPGERCDENTDCCDEKCDSNDYGECFLCIACSGGDYCSGNTEDDLYPNECEAQCDGVDAQCDDKEVDTFWSEGENCVNCKDCSYESVNTIGSCTCSGNCVDGYCLEGALCYYNLDCTENGWQGEGPCDTAESCGGDTMVTGKSCSSSGCGGDTHVCDDLSACGPTVNCGGDSYTCHYSNEGNWEWDTAIPTTETACDDEKDNDCDGLTDEEDDDCISCGDPGDSCSTDGDCCLGYLCDLTSPFHCFECSNNMDLWDGSCEFHGGCGADQECDELMPEDVSGDYCCTDECSADNTVGTCVCSGGNCDSGYCENNYDCYHGVSCGITGWAYGGICDLSDRCDKSGLEIEKECSSTCQGIEPVCETSGDTCSGLYDYTYCGDPQVRWYCTGTEDDYHWAPEGGLPEEDCNDGRDNDCDGHVDLADDDCRSCDEICQEEHQCSQGRCYLGIGTNPEDCGTECNEKCKSELGTESCPPNEYCGCAP